MKGKRQLLLVGTATGGGVVGYLAHSYFAPAHHLVDAVHQAASVAGTNITLTVIVSVFVLIASWRRDRLTLLGNLNKQVQDYNLAIFKDEKLAGQVAELFPGADGRWVQGLYSTFYLINMIRDGKHITESYRRPNLLFDDAEMVKMISKDYPEQIVYILDNERGYAKKFKDYIWVRLKSCHDANWISDIRHRLAERASFVALSAEGSLRPNNVIDHH